MSWRKGPQVDFIYFVADLLFQPATPAREREREREREKLSDWQTNKQTNRDCNPQVTFDSEIIRPRRRYDDNDDNPMTSSHTILLRKIITNFSTIVKSYKIKFDFD